MAVPLEYNKPDLTWEMEDEIKLIEVGCPLDKNVRQVEEDTKDVKYIELTR